MKNELNSSENILQTFIESGILPLSGNSSFPTMPLSYELSAGLLSHESFETRLPDIRTQPKTNDYKQEICDIRATSTQRPELHHNSLMFGRTLEQATIPHLIASVNDPAKSWIAKLHLAMKDFELLHDWLPCK